MSRIENFVTKKFHALPKDIQRAVIDEISSGANYQCEEPLKGGHKWTAKPGEIVDECPICGSKKISLNFKKIRKHGKQEYGGVLFFPYEEW